ncbi:HAD family hydrolase [Amycolatopsis sp. NPDC048633]|uniref:HAD family hydrolase n=1 Tax=Amycolatopsis sp. NPDC048633 TaxID=3157095 RepID=UPI0033E32EF6
METVFSRLVATVLGKDGIAVVGFDLGGTLFDRTPLHVSSTARALGIDDAAVVTEVDRLVREELRVGSNSNTWLPRIAHSLGIKVPNFEMALRAKRQDLATLQRAARMPVEAVELLISIGRNMPVRIVSQGHVDETRDLLNRSFSAVGRSVADILVLGRDNDTDGVAKVDLLHAAFSGFEPCECLFVGDSLNDASSSAKLGLHYINFSPFSSLG